MIYERRVFESVLALSGVIWYLILIGVLRCGASVA